MEAKDTTRRDTFARLERFKELEVYPFTVDYAVFLQVVCRKKRISKEKARSRYGLYTYRQWHALLCSD